MPSRPDIVRNPENLRSMTRSWRAKGESCAIVPTMGALHEGHLSLIGEAARRADRVVVSIFINPKQFGQNEDLAKYPRNETADNEMLAEAGVHLVYAPSVAEVYPPGFSTTVSMAGPAAAGLEDKYRPKFFEGVATIVAKLLTSAECDFAMFGEKDYQQLKVVTRLVHDLNIPTKIVPCPTVREPDGLAMSSRNVYLTAKQRQLAPHLYQSLLRASTEISDGRKPASAVATARRTLAAAGFRTDYLTARNAETLRPPTRTAEALRILAAAWLGRTRLIDNVSVPHP